MMCSDAHTLPSKAQSISFSATLMGTPQVDQAIALCFSFHNLDLGWPSDMYICVPPISLNVSHEVQYLQTVVIGG